MLEKFRKTSFSAKDATPSDKGVFVRDVVKLIEKSPYREDLCNLMQVDSISDEFIAIPGARKLVQQINAKNNAFKKVDLDVNFKNLEFTQTSDEKFAIAFNASDEETGEVFGDGRLVATPIYSARSDFFSSLYNMDRYANSLIENGHEAIVHSNLEALREVYNNGSTHLKKYRLLIDADGCYFRALTSCKNYFDYNNNIAVFIALLALHREDDHFRLLRCEYNESFIRMFFEKEGGRAIEKVGKANYVIEVSNDEVKREALRFSGVMSLICGDSDKDESTELFIKPKDYKTSFLAIKHNVLPETAIKELSKISKQQEVEEEMFKDVDRISEISNPEQIKYLIKSKVESLKSNDLTKYKREILKELLVKVDSIYELLKLMNKINLIVEDIDAKEYLRYIMHEALINRE